MATILVVDDHPTNREFLVTLLGYQGHRLIEAANGLEGLTQAQNQPPNLIISDVLMPMMDGYEFVRRLRAEPALASTPIIFYTAYYQEVEAQTLAQACGVPYLLPKPSKPQVILKMVETALGSTLLPVPSPPPEAFDREHLRLLTNKLSEKVDELEQQIAERRQAEEELEQRATQLALINDIGSKIAALLELEGVLERAARLVQENFGYHHVALFLVEGEQAKLKAIAGSYQSYFPPNHSQSLSQGIIGWVGSHGEKLIVNNIDAAGIYISLIPDQTITKSELCLPIKVAGRVEGILDIQSPRLNAFSENDIVAMETLADQIAVAIANARLYQAMQIELAERKRAETHILQNADRAEALVRVAARLNAQLDLETVLKTVSEEAAHALNVPAAAVRLYDEQREVLYYTNAFGLGSDYGQYVQPAPRVLFDQLFRQHNTFIITPDVQAIPNMPNARLYAKLNIRTIISVSLERGQQWIGVLSIFTFGEVRDFSQDELVLLKGLADQAAQAMTNARLFDTVQQELAERKQAEAALAEERALLARRVEERTMELSVANAELGRTARLKDEFLANMSHELRTPLNAILGLSETLLERISGPLTERQARSVQLIEESGHHLLALINDILDLSKIEAGKLELYFEQVLVEPLCQASLQFIKQMAFKKCINISFKVDNTEMVLWADTRRLKQILVNLLSNAVKFTPENGQIGLEVTEEPEREVIHFTVWDTGIGITSEDLPDLFKPFIQLDSSLTRQQEGTGLGLALVSRLLDLHGGSITVESQVGRGSRFTISLPWTDVAEITEKPEPAPARPVPLPFRRALVIEDSPPAADQLARYLRQLGVETVTIHPRGEGAIETALQAQAEVILLDIQLSTLSGWEVLSQLKRNPQTAGTPVIIVTVVDEPQRGLAQGAVEYLVKPVSRQLLRAALHKAARSLSAASVVTPAKPPESLIKEAKPPILLAEDNEANIRIMADYLADKNYHVIIARNGLEAIDRARETLPALILMDIQMPKMDGLEATRRLRADPQLAQTPIIALTALAMSGDRERCLAAGANEYMSKPISLKNLVRLMETYLNQS